MLKARLAAKLVKSAFLLIFAATVALQVYDFAAQREEDRLLPRLRAESARELCAVLAKVVHQELFFNERMVLALAQLWAPGTSGTELFGQSVQLSPIAGGRPLCLAGLEACSASSLFTLNVSQEAREYFTALDADPPFFLHDYFRVFNTSLAEVSTAVISVAFDTAKLSVINAAVMEYLAGCLELAAESPPTLALFTLLARSTRVDPNAVGTRYYLQSRLPFRANDTLTATECANTTVTAGTRLTVRACYSASGALNRKRALRLRLRRFSARAASRRSPRGVRRRR